MKRREETDMVIRSRKIKRTRAVCVDDAHRIGTTQKYREKVIEQGKVPVCCANTHRLLTCTYGMHMGGPQAPPHCAVKR
jgi:LDH2 family malate/lactate/ureidoglycolate dehydrogenase